MAATAPAPLLPPSSLWRGGPELGLTARGHAVEHNHATMLMHVAAMCVVASSSCTCCVACCCWRTCSCYKLRWLAPATSDAQTRGRVMGYVVKSYNNVNVCRRYRCMPGGSLRAVARPFNTRSRKANRREDGGSAPCAIGRSCRSMHGSQRWASGDREFPMV